MRCKKEEAHQRTWSGSAALDTCLTCVPQKNPTSGGGTATQSQERKAFSVHQNTSRSPTTEHTEHASNPPLSARKHNTLNTHTGSSRLVVPFSAPEGHVLREITARVRRHLPERKEEQARRRKWWSLRRFLFQLQILLLYSASSYR